MIDAPAIAFQILQSVFVVLAAPLLMGWANQCRAWLQNRSAPSILLPYYTLVKLFHKDAVIARNASAVFRVTPYVVFGCMWLAVGIARVNAGGAPDVGVRPRDRKRIKAVRRGRGDGDAPIHAVRACVREHVPDPAPELLEREVAVRVDHPGLFPLALPRAEPLACWTPDLRESSTEDPGLPERVSTRIRIRPSRFPWTCFPGACRSCLRTS